MFSKKRVGILLAGALLLVGSTAAVTLALLSARTVNPGNTLASGTLVLLNTRQGGTTCASTAGGTTDTNVNNSCDTLLNVSVAKPGDSATGRVTLRNDGSVNASALELFTAACTSAAASGQTYSGTGNLCDVATVYVQGYSDATFTTVSSCLYGGGTATTCAHSDATKTITNFGTTYPSSTPFDLGAVAAGAYRYYEIGVSIPSSAGNSYQGRSASFPLTWTLQQ